MDNNINYELQKQKFLLLNRIDLCVKEFKHKESILQKLVTNKNNIENMLNLSLYFIDNPNLYNYYVNINNNINIEIEEIKKQLYSLLFIEHNLRMQL